MPEINYVQATTETTETQQSQYTQMQANVDETATNQAEKIFTQSDVDKIVKDRLFRERQKLEKEKEESVTEAIKLQRMNEDQKAEYEKQKKLDDLAKREKDITTRELKAQAYETLAEKGLSKELVDILNYDNAEQCNKSIEAVEKAFQLSVEKAINEKLRGNGVPKGNTGNQAVDTSQMTYTELVAYMTDNPGVKI